MCDRSYARGVPGKLGVVCRRHRIGKNVAREAEKIRAAGIAMRDAEFSPAKALTPALAAWQHSVITNHRELSREK